MDEYDELLECGRERELPRPPLEFNRVESGTLKDISWLKDIIGWSFSDESLSFSVDELSSKGLAMLGRVACGGGWVIISVFALPSFPILRTTDSIGAETVAADDADRE